MCIKTYKEMTYKDAKIKYNLMGYKFRTEKMALNIFGIRSKNSQSNKFDDLGGVAWIDEQGNPQIMNFWMTTDPGKDWLLNPMNKNGCIITVPGQYLEVFQKGLHSGKYPALVQRKPMLYVRDNNRDSILDFSLYQDPEKRKKFAFWGINGTNFHRASGSKIVDFVTLYSAGCSVVQRPETFNKIMDLVDKSIKFGFINFDYTLFEE